MKCAPLILRFMVIKESPLALCAVPPFARGTKKYNMRVSSPPFKFPCYFGTDVDS